MRKIKTSIVFMFLWASLGFACTAQAGLISRGYGLVYDSDQNITWLQDANYFATQTGGDGMMDWAIANDWANKQSFAGNTGWRLPTADGSCDYSTDCTTSELGHLFYIGLGGTRDEPISSVHNANFNLFLNIQDAGYWTQTEFADDNTFAWNFDNLDGTQLPYDKNDQFYGWAVHAGNVSPIPEPSAWLLMLAGLLGWALFDRQAAKPSPECQSSL